MGFEYLLISKKILWHKISFNSNHFVKFALIESRIQSTLEKSMKAKREKDSDSTKASTDSVFISHRGSYEISLWYFSYYRNAQRNYT